MIAGPTRIYLDNCCLGRPFDDMDQDRIRFEAEAVLLVEKRIKEGLVTWVTSQALIEECSNNSNSDAREHFQLLLEYVGEVVVLESHDTARAKKLYLAGMGMFDALHLVAAEVGYCDVLLTTDDKFIKKAARAGGESLSVKVMNPVDWLRKVINDENK